MLVIANDCWVYKYVVTENSKQGIETWGVTDMEIPTGKRVENS